MNALVTFSGRAYDETTALIVERAPKMGADRVLVYDDTWLQESGYVSLNKWMYELRDQIGGVGRKYNHGYGWCSWKSLIIQHAFERASPSDVVLYLDADTVPIADFSCLYDYCRAEGGVYLFAEAGCYNIKYTRADCMVAMGLSVADSQHGCGRFSLWQKGPLLPRQMLNEWWAYSVNPMCTGWGLSTVVPDHKEYDRNSAEQSVLSNLARKYKLPLHRTPDQAGESEHFTSDRELYGQLFEQIGTRMVASTPGGSRFRNV